MVKIVQSSAPEYKAWDNAKQRCFNVNNKSFPYYGGRGITMCDRWLDSFENFLADMEPRPSSKHSLDRIDVNGNYEPSNCRWVTYSEQMRNRRAYSNSGIKYVSWDKYKKNWRVQKKIHGKQRKLGSFKNLEEAIELAKQFME